jgi:cystathionine gamma-synthase
MSAETTGNEPSDGSRRAADAARAGWRPESVLIARGRPADVPDGPINQPLVLSATFHAGGDRGYARDGTVTSDAFEDAMGALDGGEAIAFSSGMAAAAALIGALPTGSTVVLPTTYYNLHRSLLEAEQALGRLAVRTVDTADTAATLLALEGATLIWLELPTNPTLEVLDLPAITAAARAQGIRTVVDATVATPLGLRPLDHGADVVLHSATKWIAGHSDLLMGVLVTADGQLASELRTRRRLTGAMPGALESYLALRGLRTLAVRLDRACANTATLALRLREHPAVTGVHYLGFAEHPQADRIALLLAHHGAMLSFTVDSVQRADALCQRVQLITHATSLGGVESLIERRGQYPGELAQGTPPELVRLSVGLEHVDDLWADLAAGLGD